MNRTHLEHSVIALAIQLALWPVLGPWGAGFTACALFLGREIAQHEYKLAREMGWEWGQDKPGALYLAFFEGWSKDSILDVALPALACGLVALAGEIWL